MVQSFQLGRWWARTTWRRNFKLTVNSSAATLKGSARITNFFTRPHGETSASTLAMHVQKLVHCRMIGEDRRLRIARGETRSGERDFAGSASWGQ